MAVLFFKISKLLSILFVPQFRNALLRYRVAAGTEHIPALRNLGPIKTVVDIGANRGQFSLAARYCFPDAMIFAFEPLPEPARLWRMVFKNDRNTRLVMAAVGREAGVSVIHLSEKDDSSSLLPITARQNMLFPGTKELTTKKIQVVRLDQELSFNDLIPRALLKIDVQGYELEVLVGCKHFLDHFEWIYVECSFIELYQGQSLAHDIIAFLHELKFLLVGVYNIYGDHDGAAVQGDFLFRASRPGVLAPASPIRRDT